MAQISIHVSTQHESTFNVQWDGDNPELLAIDTEVNLEPLVHEGAQPIPYERTTINFHGTVADLRGLSKQIVAALAPSYSSYPVALELTNTEK